MTAQLTVHNAQVTTATVQIKTLTISGKQVTLAVFRQLPERRLTGGEGELRGLPWGTVNYHPDKCTGPGTRPHLHVVWQDGDTLYRDRIHPPEGPNALHCSDFAFDLVQAEYCLNGHQDPPWFDRRHCDGGRCVHFRLDSDSMMIEAWNRPVEHRQRPDWPSYATSEAPEFEPCRTVADRDESLKLLCEEVTEARERRTREQASWDELTGLPQLFIAV